MLTVSLTDELPEGYEKCCCDCEFSALESFITGTGSCRAWATVSAELRLK